MHTVATTEEKLNIVYLCLTTGLPYFVSYGFSMDYDSAEYQKAREALSTGNLTDTVCSEDVQKQMLRMGYGLRFIDEESLGEESVTLNLSVIESNWDKVRAKDLAEMGEDGNWDAETADCIMQCLLFGEIVYG